MPELLRRGEVMRRLGIGQKKMRQFIEAGVLTPRHFILNRKGRPMDRAMFVRVEIDRLLERRN